MFLHFSRTIAVSLLVSTPLFAQSICYSENDTPTFNDGISMGGPNELLAIRFSPSSSFSVTRIEVFTGEGFGGSNSLTLWTHDAATSRPGAQIAAPGTWTMSLTNSWQGVNLPASIAVTSGTTYWVVWGCLTQSQASVDVPMATPGQPYSASFDGGQSWSGPFQGNDHHWKFRLFGSCGGSPVTPFCFGDGTQAVACPCANAGSTGHGCQNSASTGGALLSATGTTNPDTLVFTTAGELASVLSLVMQSDTSSAGATFGDGVTCLAGTQRKLYVKHASLGSITAPVGADPSVSQRSAALGDTIPSGATRYYQVVYRDPSPQFCAGGGKLNVTNGLTVVW